MQVSVDLGDLAPPPAPATEAPTVNVRRAVVQCSLALAVNPLNPEAYYRRGLALALLEQWPEACADGSRALLLDPSHVAAHYLRGQAQQQLGRNRRASADFAEAIRREPGRAPSLAELQQALAIDRLSALAHNNPAYGYVKMPAGQRVLGLALFLADKAVLLDPGNWYCENTLGVVYYRLGRWHQAVDTLQRAGQARKNGISAFDLFYLAMAFHRLGQLDRARDCQRRATEWWREHKELGAGHVEELTALRAEAAAILGVFIMPHP